MFSWFGSKSEDTETKNEAADPKKDEDTKITTDDLSKENKTDEHPVTTTAAASDGPKSQQSSAYSGLTGAMGQFLTVD